jgi:hypothetical protein
VVVGLVAPDLGRGVVGRAGLCVEQAVLRDLRHVEVADLDLALVRGEQNVGTLEVAVHDFLRVQVPEAGQDLLEVDPDDVFLERGLHARHALDVLEEIPAVCIVRHDAELFGSLVEEGVAVGSSGCGYR